ncbi:MAG: hypothetical protein Q8N77_02105 [Nanoarchaeota archaeon]|nr:hypothetical protein [Nanoarchaeota archaeon]
MKGMLIACEGLDCSGKTTAIKEILKGNDKRFVYSKGIGSSRWIGKISRRVPSTIMFLTELAYITLTETRPHLNRGRIVLQDRHDISITSYVPSARRLHNRLLIRLFKPLIKTPDAIVYFSLPLSERIRRLREKGAKYELMLADNPSLIIAREKEYMGWYKNFSEPKLKIDTDKNDIKQTARMLREFITRLTNDYPALAPKNDNFAKIKSFK